MASREENFSTNLFRICTPQNSIKSREQKIAPSEKTNLLQQFCGFAFREDLFHYKPFENLHHTTNKSSEGQKFYNLYVDLRQKTDKNAINLAKICTTYSKKKEEKSSQICTPSSKTELAGACLRFVASLQQHGAAGLGSLPRWSPLAPLAAPPCSAGVPSRRRRPDLVQHAPTTLRASGGDSERWPPVPPPPLRRRRGQRSGAATTA